MKPSFFCSWSGGKDSCYALMKAKELGFAPTVLLNMMNEEGEISRSHAIPKAILEKQAEMLRLPIVTKPANWEAYESIFITTLNQLKTDYKITHGVFGDIDLQAHRDWEEKVCNAVGIEAMLPLWKRNRKELVFEMLDAGIETYIVSCNEVMGPSFLGKQVTRELVEQLEEIGVDACGENGEYHTLVTNMPLFKNRILISFGENRQHNSYWFTTMKLSQIIL
jgi:diphthine-ammonia ligase